jgi:hypothetical protein
VSKRFFTLEEANRLLPVIREDLLQLQRMKQEFDAKYRELQMLKAGWGKGGQAGEDPFFEREAELEFLNIQARGVINRISGTGAQLKDIDMGLVDFPAFINGREVLLCWRVGEESVEHWHHPWEGYLYRKKIAQEEERNDE